MKTSVYAFPNSVLTRLSECVITRVLTVDVFLPVDLRRGSRNVNHGVTLRVLGRQTAHSTA